MKSCRPYALMVLPVLDTTGNVDEVQAVVREMLQKIDHHSDNLAQLSDSADHSDSEQAVQRPTKRRRCSAHRRVPPLVVMDAYFSSLSFIVALRGRMTFIASMNEKRLPAELVKLATHKLPPGCSRVLWNGKFYFSAYLDRLSGKLVMTVSTTHQHTPHFSSAPETAAKLPFSKPRLSEETCEDLCTLKTSSLRELAALVGVRGGGDKREIAYRMGNRQEPPPDLNIIRLIIKNTKETTSEPLSSNEVRYLPCLVLIFQ